MTDRTVDPVQGQRPDAWMDLDLLTPDDVCALLKVKKSWLYDTVESGAIEAIKLGKQLRFRASALARYLDASAKGDLKLSFEPDQPAVPICRASMAAT